MAAFFLIDMHQNLEKPPESLGMEMEPDDNDTSDFQQRYSLYEFMWLFLPKVECGIYLSSDVRGRWKSCSGRPVRKS